MPQLTTERLLLRPMTAADVEPLLAVFTDPRVMASFGGGAFTREQMSGWVRRNLEHQEDYGYGLFTLVLRETGEVIGDCGLEHMELAGEPAVELGYDLRSDQWGRGLATEAARAVRDFAFGELGLPSLVSLIRTGNAASIRVAEKVGMSFLRELDAGEIRYLVYRIARSDLPRSSR